MGQGRRSGAVMSTAQMSADLGAISGPLLAGLVVDTAGYGWAFALTGALAVLAAAYWLTGRETRPRELR